MKRRKKKKANRGVRREGRSSHSSGGRIGIHAPGGKMGGRLTGMVEMFIGAL